MRQLQYFTLLVAGLITASFLNVAAEGNNRLFVPEYAHFAAPEFDNSYILTEQPC